MKSSKKHATFSQWAADRPPGQKKLVTALRKLVEKAAPTLTETVKWTNGCWVGREWPVAFLHAEDDHLQFGFFAGASLADPGKLLQGSGKYVRHVKIRKPGDIDESAFKRLLRQAVKIERE